MKLSTFIALPLLCCLLVACNKAQPPQQPATENAAAEQPAPSQPQEKEQPEMVGNDSDEHGCKASAGYTWSLLLNECVRPWEAGVFIEAQDPSLDQTQAAHLITKKGGDLKQIEIYIPKAGKPMLYDLVSDEGSVKTWKNGNYVMTRTKGLYELKENGKLLYKMQSKTME
ncbi:MAG: hypothetical protein IPN76_30525 [Saprospiraceae bacterium]|nr:hypothetical protein [Saprospiraceae bacterium]